MIAPPSSLGGLNKSIIYDEVEKPYLYYGGSGLAGGWAAKSIAV